MQGDQIEFGESGWVSTVDGMYNKNSGVLIAKDGKIYNKFGEVIDEPDEEDQKS